MATVNSLSVILTGNSAQLTRVLQNAGREIRGLEAQAGAGSKALKGIGIAGTAAAVGLVYATTQAAAFEKAMHNVASIDSQVRDNFAKTEKQVLALSTVLPTSAKDLAEGLYDISSSGFSGAKSLDILKASATAASAGLTTTASSAKAITAVLNAYGLSADQATRVSDTLFETVNYGVIDFEELTGVISQTVGVSAAAGISIEQLGSAVATITLSGATAAEAGTQLNQVLNSLIKPNEKLIDVQKQLGVSFVDQLKDPAVGLKGVLDELLKSTGGNTVAFSNLFSNIRASRGVLALEANDGKNYTRVLEKMGIASDNTGATQKALAEQSKGLSYQLNILKNKFQESAIALGLKLGPALKDLIDVATKAGHALGKGLAKAAEELKPAWDDLVAIGKNLTTNFKDLWQAAGPVVKVMAELILAGVAKAFDGVGKAVEGATGFFADHKAILLGVAGAITMFLLPALVALTIKGYQALGLALVNLVIRFAAVGSAVLATNPILAGIAVAVGAAAFAITAFGKDNRDTKVDVESLTDAIKTQVETLNSAPLATKILDEISNWKPTSGDIGGVAYLKKYGVGVSDLVKQIADPKNAHAFTDFTAGLDKLTRLDLSSGGKFGGNAKEMAILQKAMQSTNPEIRQFATLFSNLEKDPSVNGKTIRHLYDAFLKLGGGIDVTRQKLIAQEAVQKKLTASQHKNADSSKDLSAQLDKMNKKLKLNADDALAGMSAIDAYLSKVASSSADLASAQDGLKTAQDGVADKQKAYNTALSGFGATSDQAQKAYGDLQKAVQGVSDAQTKLDAAQPPSTESILKKLGLDDTTLNQLSGAAQKLVHRGITNVGLSQLLSLDDPRALLAFANGPQDAITKLNKAVGKFLTDSGPQSFSALKKQFKKDGSQGVKAYADGVNLSTKLTTDAYIHALVQPAAHAIGGAIGIIDGFARRDASGHLTKGLEANQKRVLDAYLQQFPVPVQQAVRQALVYAGGGARDLASTIVGALIKAKPEAVGQAADLYAKVQGQLNLLTGKELRVVLKDLASGNLDKLNTDLATFNQLREKSQLDVARAGSSGALAGASAIDGAATGGQMLGGKFVRAGRGAPIVGHGSQRGDMVSAFVAPEEWIIQAPASRLYGSAAMRSVNDGTATIIPHFARGGEVANKPTIAGLTSGQFGPAPTQGFSTTYSSATLGDAARIVDDRILALIARMQAAMAGPAQDGPGQSFNEIIQYGRRGPAFTAALPDLGRGGSSYHEQGKAVDFSGGDMGAMAAYWHRVAGSLLEEIHTPGYYVKNGRDVGPGFYGQATVDQHYNHVHVAATLQAMQQLLGNVAGGGGNGVIPGGANVAGFGGSIQNIGNYLLANQMMRSRGYNAHQVAEVDAIWTQESGFNANAYNPNGGAYGIPQAYPPAWGHPYALGDAQAQINWGINYINSIGGPDAAYRRKASTGTYAAGGPVEGEAYATGGPTSQEQVAAYLQSLNKKARDQAAVNKYLTSLYKASGGGNLYKFLTQQTRLGLGYNTLAVRGIQDAYNEPNRNNVWDQRMTDWVSVHRPQVGKKTDPIKYLQLALKRPITGKLNPGDIPEMYKKINAIAFPEGSFLQKTTFDDKRGQEFQGYLERIVSRGFAPLADDLSQLGVDSGFAGARQMATAPYAVLQKAQAAYLRTSANTKYPDALKLAADLAQYGGKVGLLGLASRSGTGIADVVGLVAQFPDVFKAVGRSSRLLEQDMKRLARGEQPVAAYSSGADEIKRDHVAVVHKGEAIVPTDYAVPWRKERGMNTGSAGGVTLKATVVQQFSPDIPAGQIRRLAKQGAEEAISQVTAHLKRGTGSRP